jgi:Phycobilisome degradation protein nblA
MNPESFQLSMEQQFTMQRLRQDTEHLDDDSVIDSLLDTMYQLMVRDNLIRDLVRKSML